MRGLHETVRPLPSGTEAGAPIFAAPFYGPTVLSQCTSWTALRWRCRFVMPRRVQLACNCPSEPARRRWPVRLPVHERGEAVRDLPVCLARRALVDAVRRRRLSSRRITRNTVHLSEEG